MNKFRTLACFLIFCSALVAGGCAVQSPEPVVQAQAIDPDPANWVEYTLTTGMEGGRMVFVGVGGEIDGRVNPDLTVHRGGTIRVTRRIGEGRAKEMMFFGDPITVETAQAWGLINRVVPKGEALTTAREMARRLAAQPNIALQMCKQSIDMAFDTTEEAGVRASLSLSDKAFSTADCAEGVRAFFAKEPPRFKHR